MNDNTIPDIATATSMLHGAIRQIEFARQYTLELLEATPQDVWFDVPEGLPTNVAWQVGHLTVSQYGLLMFRMRGRRPADLDLIPGKFRKSYSRQSVPKSDRKFQPSPDELYERLSQIHKLAMEEVAAIEPAILLDPVDMPYAAFPIKLGAIMFCPMHELIHAGQIGLLRRALGLSPVR
jgi:hypothetical protein